MINRARMISLSGGAALAAILPPGTARAGVADPELVHDAASLRAELKWLHDTLIEVGCKPFASCDQERWGAMYTQTMAKLDKPMNAYQYWLEVGPLFASLNDGHVGVIAFHSYYEERNTGGLKVPPLAMEIRPTGMFITTQTVAELPYQAKILRIADVGADDLSANILRYVGGPNAAMRYAHAGGAIGPYMYARFGKVESFHIEAESPDGKHIQVTVPSMLRSQVRVMNASTKSDGPYTFSRISNGQIGFIDYRACEDLDAFKKFLETTFTSIKADPVKGLIIDIRENGGGNSDLNDVLWSYVSEKPFTQGGASSMKVSDRLKREYGQKKFVEIYSQEAWSARDGSIITDNAIDLVKSGPNPLRYDGLVYLLIGPATFSSAMECAVAAKDYGLATIVGGETAEPVNSTGEVYGGRAATTGVDYFFTTKYFMGPKPRPDGQGVVPDVAITPTEDDIRKGRDPVMEYAVKKILG